MVDACARSRSWTTTRGNAWRSKSMVRCVANTFSPRWLGLRIIVRFPRYIKADNGSEFISKALDKWAYENGVEIDFSRPGKPTDNAKNESFSGRFREECLNAHWFLSLEDARRKIEVWREYYNEAALTLRCSG
ncbi:integrase catalytic domain-containing protein [Burkholderia pseudomallei]|uniref:integrase catalytic domain-containing protein n=1 Tax=Burkholderia pseudomallei TaxID=28450 RepID=UPI002D1FA080|nr:integrase core domain-containing protein [Burkholderia pseudomallei]